MTEKEKNQNDGKFDIKLKKLKKMNQQRMSTSQEAIDDYYDFEIVNSISTADWILLMLIILFWIFY